MAVSRGFHVQLGINDTALTRALEIGDDQTAALLIEENAALDPSYLNEGPYERVPLYIVLCGKSIDGMPQTRNLYLTRLLLLHGADPNKRVPMYEMGVMVYAIGSSRSPVELLILYYIECLKKYSNNIEQVVKYVIGLNNKTNLTFAEIRAELLELVDLFIVKGAEVNLQYGSNQPMLNYLLETWPDIDLVQRLCDAGVDLNLTDAHGNTSLIALCQADNVDEAFKITLRENQKEVLHYLLSERSLTIDTTNCQGQSALWLCLSAHRWDLAQQLLQAGANPITSGLAFISADQGFKVPGLLVAERVPAWLSAIIGNGKSTKDEDEELTTNLLLPFTQRKNIHGLATLVDKGLFSAQTENLENNITSFLSWMEPFAVHAPLLGELHNTKYIVPNMFGNLTTSLKQLCIRSVFLRCLSNYLANSNCQCCCNSSCFRDASESSLPSLNCLFKESKSYVKQIVKQLKIPSSFENLFELELFRWKVLVVLSTSFVERVPCGCNDLEMFADDTDVSDSSLDSSEEEINEEQVPNFNPQSVIISHL